MRDLCHNFFLLVMDLDNEKKGGEYRRRQEIESGYLFHISTMSFFVAMTRW